MVSTTYGTGSWIGLVRSGSVIALDGQTAPAIVNHMWDYLGQDATIHGVLNELTEAFGTGLTGMPDFAILVQSDRLHAILRGDITLLARSADGIDQVSGRDVTTWSERSLPLPDSLLLTFAEPGGTVAARELPVTEGVVLLQSLRRGTQAPTGAEFATPVSGQARPEPEAEQEFGSESVPELESMPEAVPEPEVGPESGEAAARAGAEAEAYAAFAMAAEAAEAEWNAQLAPVAALELEPGDPEPGDSELAESDVADADVSAAEFLATDEVRPDEADTDEAGADEVPTDSAADEPPAAIDMEEEGAAADPSATLHSQAHGHDDDSDLNLTIRPYLDEDEFEAAAADGDTPELGPEAPSAQDSRHGGAGSADELSHGDVAPSAEDAADDGFTINYDFLFGATLTQSVEDAAVRADDNGHEQQSSPAEAIVPPRPPMPPAAGVHGSEPRDSDPDSVESPPTSHHDANPADPEAAAPGAADTAQASQTVQETDGLMIDSVPWATSGQEAVKTPVAGLPTSGSVPTSDSGGFAWAAGTTSDASVEAYDADHDGHTVMRAAANQAPTAAIPREAQPLDSRPPTGPMVLARMCPSGHANPPSRATCSVCGAGINAEPREVGRPRLGTMHISSGEVVELDHSLIIGRQPSVSRVMGGAMPRLIQVKSGNGDISRSHVEVRLDGWDVLLVDLKATNGTVLVREGQAPRRLSQGEEAILLNGDIAELGDGVSLLFDGLL